MPFFSADVLKKCALIALHLIAEEGSGGEDGCHASGLGDEWEMGGPKSAMWESEGEAWSEDESVSSDGSGEGNCGQRMRCTSSGCMGLVARSLSLLAGLVAGEGGFELPHGPGHAVPGNARGLVAGLPRPRGPLSQQENRGRAVTKKQRDVVRETERRRNVSDEPFCVELACRVLSNFVTV